MHVLKSQLLKNTSKNWDWYGAIWSNTGNKLSHSTGILHALWAANNECENCRGRLVHSFGQVVSIRKHRDKYKKGKF